MDASDGKVVVRYPRFRGLGPRRDAADVALSSAVRWIVCVRGGASKLHAGLHGLELAALEIGGGASKVELILPRPRGTVRVRVQGGASQVTVRRPGDVAVRLLIGGGASALSLDEQRLGSAGGELRLETPGWRGAADRYELEVTGGASRLTVTVPDDGARKV